MTSQNLQICDKAHNPVSQEIKNKDVIFKRHLQIQLRNTHLMCAMGEVQTSNVHSRLDHLLQYLHRTGGGSCTKCVNTSLTTL